MRTGASFTLAAALLFCVAAHAEEQCGNCHPDVKTQHEQGIHAPDLSCTACHGGDPGAIEVEAAHSVATGYRGKIGRVQVPDLCGSCHADPDRMRPFGLSTDQYPQYRASGHGRRLEQGDTRTAICTDCHGTHLILSRHEPTSPVYPQNIPQTCGRCHSNVELMSAYNFPADPVEKFEKSVHGRALLVDKHPSAPTCATCHGTHGALAPQVGSIGAVCGHCHARTREYFNDGPHGPAAAEGKMSECVSCHGYHDAAPPDRSLFDTACGTCHAADTPPVSVGQKMKTLVSRAEEALEASAAVLDRAERYFPTVTRYRARLLQANAYLLEALPVQHSLDFDRVEDLTRSARSVAEEVQASVHGVQQESQLRYVVLALAWLFILFAATVAYLYRRETKREKGRGDVGRREA